MVASDVRSTLLPRSKICDSDSSSLDSASWMIGTVEALYARMNGGLVAGGANRSCVCDTPVICAYDSSSLTVGWKKYFTTAMPFSDCDSVCCTSLTVVCATRSENSTIRLDISSGDRPVLLQVAATTGILIFGKMS